MITPANLSGQAGQAPWPVTVAVLASIRSGPRDTSMKSVREHMDMHAAYREVGSYRAAAEICGTTPKTVKRSVEAALRAEGGPVPGEVRHNYDGVADVVAETVARTKGRITAKRLLPVAAAAGYVGSARNFRRLVAEAKVSWRSTNHRGTTTGHLGPGRHGGLRLGGDRPAVRLLRGRRLEPVPLRLLHRQPRSRGHHGGAGRVLRGHRRGAEERRSPTGWDA